MLQLSLFRDGCTDIFLKNSFLQAHRLLLIDANEATDPSIFQRREVKDSSAFSFTLCSILEGSPPHDYSSQVYLDLSSILKPLMDLEFVFLESKDIHFFCPPGDELS